MLGSLRFDPVPEATGVLTALRDAGHPMLIVSNWDSSLPDWLAHTGLLDLVDGVVTSATAGQRQARPGDLREGASDRRRPRRSDSARG